MSFSVLRCPLTQINGFFRPFVTARRPFIQEVLRKNRKQNIMYLYYYVILRAKPERKKENMKKWVSLILLKPKSPALL